MSNRKLISRLVFLTFIGYCCSHGFAQNNAYSAASIAGVYEYVYEYNTDNLIENHYIELFVTNGNVKGYYYGTSDDFDDAREGYLPGFFSSIIKNLSISGSTIKFDVEVSAAEIFNKPITPFLKSDKNSPWNMGIGYNKRKYYGEIKNNKLIIHTNDRDTRVFVKIKHGSL